MEKPIGIGMLTARFYPVQGGAEIQCRRLSKELKTSGHNITILTQKLPKTPDFELIDNIPVYRLGLPLLNGFGSFFYFISSLKTIIKKFNDFDVLHAHIASTPAIIAALFSKYFKKPSIVKFAGSRNTGDIAVSLRTVHGRLKLNFIKNNASAFVCPSNEVAQELVKYGFKKEKIHTIANGTETDSFAPATVNDKNSLKHLFGMPLEAKIVVYSGRLEKGKGIETLIDAWKEIEASDIKPQAQLAIFGSGRLASELQERASGLRNVKFYGWVDNTADYLKASDIFVLPSTGEGMPNSLMEAMSCGIGCVSTNIGGVRELITHNANGLLFEPGNHKALFECIRLLLSDHTLSSELGSAARKTILNNYTMSKIADQYIQLYRTVMV